jgi:hypothetical protein
LPSSRTVTGAADRRFRTERGEIRANAVYRPPDVT